MKIKNIRRVFLLVMSFFPCLCSAGLWSEYNYSRAAHCGQNGKWQDAQSYMTDLIVDEPDDPSVVYDNGVVAYRLGEFEKAETYFNHATNCDGSSDDLKYRAFFNLGNTHVQLRKLEDAVKAYQAALKIKPDDPQAKHNLEVAQQMLQEQKEQEKQNDNRDKKNDQDKKDDKSSQKSDQNQEQNDENQSDQEQADQNSSDKKDSSGKDDAQSSQDKQGEENKDGAESKNNQPGKEQQKKKDDREKGEQAKGDSQNKSCDQDSNQNEDHESSSKKTQEQSRDQSSGDAGFHNTHDAAKEQEMQEGASGGLKEQEQKREDFEKKFAPDEHWMVRLLHKNEQDDEVANKQAMRATVNKTLAGKHGQNCW